MHIICLLGGDFFFSNYYVSIWGYISGAREKIRHIKVQLVIAKEVLHQLVEITRYH